MDDLRVIAQTLELTWVATRRSLSRLQHQGINDTSRKRRIDNGPWAGGFYATDDVMITKSVTEQREKHCNEISGRTKREPR